MVWLLTLSVLASLGHLSQRERQVRLVRYTKLEAHHGIRLTDSRKQKQAQRIIPLCLFPVSCGLLIPSGRGGFLFFGEKAQSSARAK